MAFDEKTVGEIIRQRLTLSSAIPVLWAIPEALKQMSRKIAANPARRSLLLTNREDAVFPLAADGSVSINQIVTDKAVIREFFHHGTFWYQDVDAKTYQYPLQPLKNPAFINAPKLNGDSYLHYVIEADRLRTINFNRNLPDALEGYLLCEVPRAATLADCDALPELQPLLIEKAIEIVTGPASDSAEDGEN